MLYARCLAYAGSEREEETIAPLYTQSCFEWLRGGVDFQLPSCIFTAGATHLPLPTWVACFHGLAYSSKYKVPR